MLKILINAYACSPDIGSEPGMAWNWVSHLAKYKNIQIMNNQRNHTIDIMRGIAIFLVVFGHVTHITELCTYIWGFHMPVFFFISGLLFRREKFGSFGEFTKSRVKSLVLPYAIFYLVTFAYWVLIERNTFGADVSIESQLIGLVYGTFDMRYNMFNGVLWFLPCLFSMEMLYWFVSKCTKPIGVMAILIACYAIGLCLTTYAPWLPWGLCAAFVGVVYYGIGDLCKPLVLSNRTNLNGGYYALNFVIIILLILLQLAVLPWTSADMAWLWFGNIWLYIPISLIGITLCWLVARVVRQYSVIEYLGINSLVIFGFHGPVYRAVIFVSSKLLGWQMEDVCNNVWLCLAIAVCSIIVILPFIFLWNKYVKPLLKRI